MTYRFIAGKAYGLILFVICNIVFEGRVIGLPHKRDNRKMPLWK